MRALIVNQGFRIIEEENELLNNSSVVRFGF
jgi:hypothetical protein